MGTNRVQLDVKVHHFPEYAQSRALYGVSDEEHFRIVRFLAANPYRGTVRDGEQDVRDWIYGRFRVSYVVQSEDLLVLIDIAPKEEPPSNLGGKALQMLQVLKDLKRVFWNW